MSSAPRPVPHDHPEPRASRPAAEADLPAPSRRKWIFLAVGIGTFMSALDGSVVNTVLPLLRTELHASVAGIEWVTTTYLLVVSALLLGVGRAGDLEGHKRIYLGGFVLFVLGSALCGMAPSAGWLVALRGVQGVGATMLFANAPAILTLSFPVAQRGRVLGALGTMTYLGLTAGPSLGGWLAQTLGWRSVFYINVPVGAVALSLALWAVRDDRPHARTERFDYLGAVLFAAGLVALLVALNQGHAWGWTAIRTIGLLVAAAVLLAGFVAVERVRIAPMLDLTLFRSRVFSSTTVSALLNYVCVYAVLFVVPFLLIQGRGLDTQQAGLVLTAQPLVMAVTAPASGALSDRMGSRLLATVGMIVLTAGLALLAFLVVDAPIGAIALALGVIGLGVGVFVAPNNSALMGAAPRDQQGIASGVLATARNVGMVLGVGLAGAVYTTLLAHAGDAASAVPVAARGSLLVAAAVALLASVAAVVR